MTVKIAIAIGRPAIQQINMAIIANTQQCGFIINRVIDAVITDKTPPFQIFIIKQVHHALQNEIVSQNSI